MYYAVLVKVSEESLKEYLSNFYDEEDINKMDLNTEATEAIHGILSNHLSDYYCIDENTIVVGEI